MEFKVFSSKTHPIYENDKVGAEPVRRHSQCDPDRAD